MEKLTIYPILNIVYLKIRILQYTKTEIELLFYEIRHSVNILTSLLGTYAVEKDCMPCINNTGMTINPKVNSTVSVYMMWRGGNKTFCVILWLLLLGMLKFPEGVLGKALI